MITEARIKIPLEYIRRVLRYYLLMGRWLYQMGDYARAKYLLQNLESEDSGYRPQKEYEDILWEYYNGNIEELRSSVEKKKLISEDTLIKFFILSRSMGRDSYFDLIDPNTGRRKKPIFTDDHQVAQNFCGLYSERSLGSKQRRKNSKDIIRNILLSFLQTIDPGARTIDQDALDQCFTEESMENMSERAYLILNRSLGNTIREYILADRLRPALIYLKTFYSLERSFYTSQQAIKLAQTIGPSF